MHLNPLELTGIEDFVAAAATDTIRHLAGISGPLKPVADQGIRAAASAALNTAEAFGHVGRSRLHHLRTARGSAREARPAPISS